MADGTTDTTTQGNGSTDAGVWTSALPETIRGNEAFKGFQDVGGLAQAFLDVSGKVRTAPEKPDGYTFDGFPADDAGVKAFKEMAHKAGLDVNQAKELIAGIAGHDKAERESAEAAVKAEKEKLTKGLQKDWPGPAFEENMIVAKRAMALWAGPMVDVLAEAGLADHPAVLKVFRAIGKAMSETRLPDGTANNNQPQELQRTIGGTPMLDFPSMRT